MSEDAARKLVEARETGDFTTLRAVWLEAGLDARALETLAKGDAWNSVDLSRRGALWEARALGPKPLPLFAAAEKEAPAEPLPPLPTMPLGQEVAEDYRHLRLSLKQHPVALLRGRLAARRIVPADRLKAMRDGARVRVAGLVLVRQQPGTASGVIFMTLEDETGVANIIVWPDRFRRFRRAVLGSQLLAVAGSVQRDESGHVIHVVADRMTDFTAHLRALDGPIAAGEAPPYDAALARADEARGGNFERRGSARTGLMPASRDFR